MNLFSVVTWRRVPLRPVQPFYCHREMVVPSHSGMGPYYVPALSRTGWVTLDKFLHLSGEVNLRVYRGPSSSATPIRNLITIFYSFFQVTWGWSLQMLPDITPYQPLITPSQPNPQQVKLASQETSLYQWHPEHKKATQAVQVSCIYPPHPAEHRAGRYLISLQYHISSKSFNPSNKEVKTHTHN